MVLAALLYVGERQWPSLTEILPWHVDLSRRRPTIVLLVLVVDDDDLRHSRSASRPVGLGVVGAQRRVSRL